MIPRNCSFPSHDWTILSNYWHPVAFSSEVSDKPFSVTLLDEELVVYRTSDGIVVARDLCLHRGAPLSAGWMDEGEIVCPYHGFRYGGGGLCTKIPANPGAPIPAKLSLQSFLSVERYGIIWACLSNQPWAQIPPFPQFTDCAFQHFHFEPLDWSCSAGRATEGFLDVSHFAWLHAGVLCSRDNPVVPDYSVDPSENGFHFEYTSTYANPITSDPSDIEGLAEWRRVYDLTVPFGASLVTVYPHGGELVIFNVSAPTSAKRTRIYKVYARNFDQDKPLELMRAFESRIYEEDRFVMEKQRPEELPIDLHEEVHIRADRASIMYRKNLAGIGLGRTFTA
jgi:vanillate O-demethylase monooxygenase subunit